MDLRDSRDLAGKDRGKPWFLSEHTDSDLFNHVKLNSHLGDGRGIIQLECAQYGTRVEDGAGVLLEPHTAAERYLYWHYHLHNLRGEGGLELSASTVHTYLFCEARLSL